MLRKSRLNFIIEEEKFGRRNIRYDTSFDRTFHTNKRKLFVSIRLLAVDFQKSTSPIIEGIILESLQWIGETGLREAAEGRVVTAKLVCRDASQKSKLPGVFTPCVAFRVAGSQSKSSRYSHLSSASLFQISLFKSRIRKLNYTWAASILEF